MLIKRETQITFWYIIFFLSLGVFTFFSLIHIQQTVTKDELYNLVAAKTFHSKGIPQVYNIPDEVLADHPHLYLLSIVLMFKLFGDSEVVARLPGIISGLLAIIMIFFITKSFSQAEETECVRNGALSSLLYACTPAAIHSSSIIQIDNTILVPASLFIFWAFAELQRQGRCKWGIIALAVAIALWVKLTTPMIIILLLLLYVLFSRNTFRIKLISTGAIFSGILFFIVTWYSYCAVKGIPFFKSFIFPIHAFKVGAESYSSLREIVFQVLQNLIHFSLWLGIFPLLLYFIVIKRRAVEFFRDLKLHLTDIFLLGGIILIGGYTIIGGAVFGYPKYQIPAIPLIYIFIGITLSQFKMNFVGLPLRIIALIILGASVIQILIVGDLLYILRYTLRDLAVFIPSSYQEILKTIIFKILLFLTAYSILFLISMKFSFKKKMVLLMVILSLGSNIGTSLLQSTASYHTGFNYGEKGTLETIQYISERIPAKSIVIAPSEIVYYLHLPNSQHLPNFIWTQKDELKRRIADKNTSAFIYSIATNTILQIHTITTDKSIQDFLRQDYDNIKIGSYVIWIRK